MRLFLRQLGWELRRLLAQRRTWLGFGIAFFFELIYVFFLKLPAVRLLLQADFRRAQFDYHQAFSGLTAASHVMGHAFMYVAVPFLALAAAGLIAGELEDGTLRMILSRPVRRATVLLQKLLVCLIHIVAFVTFVAVSTLAIGLVLEGRGPLVMIIQSAGVLGTFDFGEGLARYALATGLLLISGCTVPLLALTLSCFRMKPAAAAVVAISVSLADGCIWVVPGWAAARPWLLTTRLVTWMHAFDNLIAWQAMVQNYAFLLAFDALAVTVAFAAFQRLEARR